MKEKLSFLKKPYFIILSVVSLFLCVTCFSYAAFTTTVERKGVLNIVTGNLFPSMTSSQLDAKNQITVPAGQTQLLHITLTNTNSVDAKYNLYYKGVTSIPSTVTIGYSEEKDVPPTSAGYTISKYDTSGNKKVIKVVIQNNSTSSVTIQFGSNVGLSTASLALPSGTSALAKFNYPYLYQKVFNSANIGSSCTIDTSDSEQNFLTGTCDRNYVWYSGKLWRVISKDPSDNSLKMATVSRMTTIAYNASGNPNFSGSYADQWLNDTSYDGFLGTLRNYSSFLKTNSTWNATQTTASTKPAKTTMVTRAVGLLNRYEFTKARSSTLGGQTLITPYSSTEISVHSMGGSGIYGYSPNNAGQPLVPVVNLLSSVKVSSGTGTKTDPYRLVGDEDVIENGTLLNTRYSGEFVRFAGVLYRIVHMENGTIKVVEWIPTRSKQFNTATSIEFNPSSSTNIAYYLNNTVYNSFTTAQKNMIVSNTKWYAGQVAGSHYKSAKCSSYTSSSCTLYTNMYAVTSTLGLPRYGELFSAMNIANLTGDTAKNFWLLNASGDNTVYFVEEYEANLYSTAANSTTYTVYVRPEFYLKNTTTIKSGTGTVQDPFIIE